jgi:hypothetical protein
MNPETITAKLNARADQKLRRFISETLDPMQKLMTVPQYWDNIVGALPDGLNPYEYEAVLIDHPSKETPNAFKNRLKSADTLFRGFRQMLFVQQRDIWREREVAEFMAKVEASAEAVHELQMEGGDA